MTWQESHNALHTYKQSEKEEFLKYLLYLESKNTLRTSQGTRLLHSQQRHPVTPVSSCLRNNLKPGIFTRSPSRSFSSFKVHLYWSESESDFYLFSLLFCLFILQRFHSEANSSLLCLHVLNNDLFLPCGLVLISACNRASKSLRLYVISDLYFA